MMEEVFKISTDAGIGGAWAEFLGMAALLGSENMGPERMHQSTIAGLVFIR